MKIKIINMVAISSRLRGSLNKGMFILVFIAGIFCLPQLSAQRIGVKSNILYDFTTTLNFGLEVGLAPQWTIDLPVNYNPWVFSENMKLKHWLIQPEVRYWFCEKFMGHFVGLHAHTGEFNVGGIKWLGMKDYRYQGTLYGAGLSYGYQWLLNTHWSLEATIGLGYAYLSHAKYPCEKCATKIEDATTNYFGPTKLGVSLIYIMK